MFSLQAGIKATHVPYKGTGPATTALLAGEIDYIFEALGSASSHIRAGTVRPIVVTSAKMALQLVWAQSMTQSLSLSQLQGALEVLSALENHLESKPISRSASQN